MPAVLSSVAFWKIVVPVATVVLGWVLNERGKRASERDRLAWEQFTRKETSYKTLLSSTEGFYVRTENAELKRQFLDEIRLCWLHAPDDVIKKAYAFLDSVHVTAQTTEEGRDLAFAEFVAALRADILRPRLINDTKFSAADYKHYGVNS